MIVKLIKKYKQHNAGSDVVVSFQEAQNLVENGIAISDKIKTKNKPKKPKK
jgi:hypothetical protein